MGALLAFVLTPIGRMVAGAGSVLLLVWGFGVHQQSKGVAKERARTQQATDNAINQANSAGAKSRSGGGVRELPFRD
jgi:hypothetical protein